jgi:hypothetical protein
MVRVNCGRIGIATALIGLSLVAACSKPLPPTAQVMARCAMKGAAIDPTAHGQPSEVDWDYMHTCMIAHGFIDVPSPQCPNGVGPNLSEQAKLNSHSPVCYERESK